MMFYQTSFSSHNIFSRTALLTIWLNHNISSIVSKSKNFFHIGFSFWFYRARRTKCVAQICHVNFSKPLVIKSLTNTFWSHLRSVLRSLKSEIELWTGIRNEIPLCCVLFYECVWYPSTKNAIGEYAKTMTKLTNNQGIILCPDCLIRKMKEKNSIQDQMIKATC